MKKIFRAGKLPWLALLFLFVPPGFVRADNLEYVTSMFWTDIRDICIQDNYAYCAFEFGLQTIDISSPDSLVSVSRLYFQGDGRDICVADGYVYLADYGAGVRIIDVHDPANPFILTTIETPRYAQGVCVGRSHIYVANSSGNLYIIDVSDPANPVPEDTYNCDNDITNIYFAQDIIFAPAGGNPGSMLKIIDVSDPGNPALLDNYFAGGNIKDIRISGDKLFLAGEGNLGFKIVDIINPAAPFLVGSYNPDSDFNSLAIYGNYTYLTASDETHIVNISDFSNPTLERINDFRADKIEISSDNIYGLWQHRGIKILNITQPLNPVLRSSYDADWYVNNVYVSEPYAYVATGWTHGLHILDITSPDNPIVVGAFEPEMGLECCNVSGNYAYGIEGASTFKVIDIADPANPVETGECHVWQIGQKITVHDNFAYVIDRDFDVVDISNPQQPLLATSVYTPGYVQSIAVSGDYLYAADIDSGLFIYDNSNPYNPQNIATYRLGQFTFLKGAFVAGDYAYLAYSGLGMVILDISDPYHPRRIALYNYTFSPRDIFVAGDLAYVIDDFDGLVVYDVSDPRSADIIAECQLPGSPANVFPSGEYIYISAHYLMLILRLTPTGIEDETSALPRDLALSQNYPNPFNTRTVINYNLPNQSYVTLDIYDMLGRKVETLLAIEQAAGKHSVEWNADNYSSGLYFYNLKADGINETRKAVLIK